MAEWIQVDPSALNKPKQERVDGVEVTVMASPYDVPDAYKSYYDEDLKRHVVEFRYLGEEPLRRQNYGPYITLRLGKRSGRIYGLEIDVHRNSKPWVNLGVKAIEEREREMPKTQKSLNYAITRRLLRDNAPKLEAAMAY
jgi:hypothetical protein